MVEGANLNQKLSFRLESVGRRIVLNSHAREGGPIFIKGGYTVGVAGLTVNQVASVSGGSTPSPPICSQKGSIGSNKRY